MPTIGTIGRLCAELSSRRHVRSRRRISLVPYRTVYSMPWYIEPCDDILLPFVLLPIRTVGFVRFTFVCNLAACLCLSGTVFFILRFR